MARAALAALALCAASCVSSPPRRYVWGGYESSVWRVTCAPDALDVGAEIVEMNELVERAKAEGRPVPPGLHAYVGYLYSLSGDLDTAAAAFESEKELYPESTVFIDGIMARLRAKS